MYSTYVYSTNVRCTCAQSRHIHTHGSTCFCVQIDFHINTRAQTHIHTQSRTQHTLTRAQAHAHIQVHDYTQAETQTHNPCNAQGVGQGLTCSEIKEGFVMRSFRGTVEATNWTSPRDGPTATTSYVGTCAAHKQGVGLGFSTA